MLDGTNRFTSLHNRSTHESRLWSEWQTRCRYIPFVAKKVLSPYSLLELHLQTYWTYRRSSVGLFKFFAGTTLVPNRVSMMDLYERPILVQDCRVSVGKIALLFWNPCVSSRGCRRRNTSLKSAKVWIFTQVTLGLGRLWSCRRQSFSFLLL